MQLKYMKLQEQTPALNLFCRLQVHSVRSMQQRLVQCLDIPIQPHDGDPWLYAVDGDNLEL